MWSIEAPLFFLLLPLPLLVILLLPSKLAASGALRVPPSVATSLSQYLAEPQSRAARVLLPWLIWAALVTALANPRVAMQSPALPTSGRDIVLALDLSGSMEKDDFELNGRPAKRIDVVRQVAAQFVRARGGDRVGLVVFAEKAYFAAAPTFDVEAVARAIEEAKIGISGKSTAISDGLGIALKRLAQSKATSRVIILLSDGVNNGGSVKPADAAALAQKLSVKVHTIAMGQRDLEANAGEPDVVDTAALRIIAQSSGGEAFRVKNTADLNAVAKSIDAMETSQNDVPTALIFIDQWIWPALLALVGCLYLFVTGKRSL